MYSINPEIADTSKPWALSRGWKVCPEREMAPLAKHIVSNPWSGIVWKFGKRSEQNFLFSDYAVLDFDSPEMPLAEALNVFCDMRHIIGTTKSHQKPKGHITCDRYRVVIPWETRITDIRKYKWNMERLYKKYPMDKCIDGARFFWPCVSIVSALFDDDAHLMEVQEPAEEYGARKEYTLPKADYRERGLMHPIIKEIHYIRVPEGRRNIFFFGASKDLLKLGYSRANIYLYIRNSATYKDCWSDSLEREIQALISSAEKQVTAECGRGKQA